MVRLEFIYSLEGNYICRSEGELSEFDECSWHAAVGIAFVDIQLQILVWDVVFKPRYDRR